MRHDRDRQGRTALTTPADRDRAAVAGFTLIEMVVVATLIGMIAAIALPQLMPAIIFGRLEGAARHLAGYGRSAMAQAALSRRPVTVRFDLDKQQYWSVIREESEDRFLEDEQGGDSKADKTKETLDLMGGPKPIAEDGQSDEGDLMRSRFNQFARTQLMARSRNVKHEGILDEIGPLFDKPFQLEDEEAQEIEVTEPLLTRTQLPEGVVIDSIRLGTGANSKGEVNVEISALGLNEPVTFYVKNEDDDYFTVGWDPITGGVRLEKGKKDLDQDAPGGPMQ